MIEDVTDTHAIIINRNRSGSMIIPGETLGVSEVTPALFAAVAANEAERAAPGVTLVDVSMIGAAGRIYLSGPTQDVRRAQQEITEVLSAVAGRDTHMTEPSPPPGPTQRRAGTTCRPAGTSWTGSRDAPGGAPRTAATPRRPSSCSTSRRTRPSS